MLSMKKLSVLFLIAILYSCSTNQDGDGDLIINSGNLQGKWYIKGGTTDGGAFEDYVHRCPTNRDYQEFLNNGEIKFVGFNLECNPTNTNTSRWNLIGNVLTVSNLPGDPMIYEYTYIIEKLTGNELVTRQTVNDPDGVFVYRITLTRN